MAVVIDASVPTPALRSFATLKSEVAAIAQGSNAPQALAVAASGINFAIRMLNTRYWYWSVLVQSITLSADDGTYTLNAHWKAPRTLMRVNGSSQTDGRIEWQDPKHFNSLWPRRVSSGPPTSYTVFKFQDDQTLTLNRPPASSFVASFPTLDHYYFRRILPLSRDSETLDRVPSEVENYIIAYGEYYVLRRFDPSLANQALVNVNLIWRSLVRDDNLHGVKDWGPSHPMPSELGLA